MLINIRPIENVLEIPKIFRNIVKKRREKILTVYAGEYYNYISVFLDLMNTLRHFQSFNFITFVEKSTFYSI